MRTSEVDGVMICFENDDVHKHDVVYICISSSFDPIADPGSGALEYDTNGIPLSYASRAWLVGLRTDLASYQQGVLRDSVYAQQYSAEWRPQTTLSATAGGPYFNAG